MADAQSLTPYFMGLIAAAVAWLFKTVIEQGKAQVALKTAVTIYLEGMGKGAARVLDSPNPTPPEIRDLLRKYERKDLNTEERQRLRQWLRDLKDSPDANKSERSAAVQLLASMEAMRSLGVGH